MTARGGSNKKGYHFQKCVDNRDVTVDCDWECPAPSSLMTKPLLVCKEDPEAGSHPWSRGSTPPFSAMDLEELTFIFAASHLAADRSSACWRSWLEEASRTIFNWKKQGPWVSQTRCPPVPDYAPKRISDKGQPWLSPKCTVNKFDHSHKPSPSPQVYWMVKCDTPVVGIPSPDPLLKNANHHPGLPLLKNCPRPPCNIKKGCQSRQPHNVQSFAHLRVNFFNSWHFTTGKLFNWPTVPPRHIYLMLWKCVFVKSTVQNEL